MGFLLLAFIAIPVAEIALFIYVGERIGLLATLVVIVLTAVVGSALVARQGAGALQQVQSAFFEARFPGKELAHGAMIVVAGAFLVTPGFITDGLGFLLLIPAVREVARRSISSRVASRTTVQFGPQTVDIEPKPGDPPEDDPIQPLP